MSDEIPNEWLFDSIENDIGRFMKSDPTILKPEICIVSGDLVYGISPNSENFTEELKRQYSQANDFLVMLCDKFFGGERSRVVIAPGNHDVDFSKVIASGNTINIPESDAERKELTSALFQENSNIRWKWNELKFFRINNTKLYDERFNEFSEMYKKFYQNKRTYSLVPELQHDFFDYPELNFSVVALNSCYRNDPFHRSGMINPSALTAACREVRAPKQVGRLVAATWHHNLTGGPMQDDYLNSELLQYLIDAGVSLGFHGHQHCSDCFDERYRLGNSKRKITIVSAGTLCAEFRNLTPGVPRGYNLVEVDTSTFTGKIHQRRMINKTNNMPIWGPGQFVETGEPFFDFTLCRPISPRPKNLDVELHLEKVSELIGEHRWLEALDQLDKLEATDIVRRFRCTALQNVGDERLIIDKITRPENIKEAVLLGGALIEEGDATEIEKYISLPFIRETADASILEVLTRLKRKLEK